jgi:hypothetical protein
MLSAQRKNVDGCFRAFQQRNACPVWGKVPGLFGIRSVLGTKPSDFAAWTLKRMEAYEYQLLTARSALRQDTARRWRTPTTERMDLGCTAQNQFRRAPG